MVYFCRYHLHIMPASLCRNVASFVDGNESSAQLQAPPTWRAASQSLDAIFGVSSRPASFLFFVLDWRPA